MPSFRHVLHTSDVHLDNVIGPTGEESPAQKGLMSVIDKSIELEVDLLLIAGDLFDHNRVKSPCLEFATEQLSRTSCPVVMITGNHDCMAEYSIYHQYDPCDAGDHIYFIRDVAGGVVDLPDQQMTVWGNGIVDHHRGNKPLGNMPVSRTNDEDHWFIGMTHGFYVNDEDSIYSSLITADEIEASPFDYLALGHVHQYRTMSHGGTQAAYPGSPNVGHTGGAMTAAHVSFDPQSGVSVDQLVLNSV
ncbi:MAG: hypothetical protein CMQ05_10720 [Gammaproteobacteria bacterium]|uniref:Calcineurin-like phosphoesterase domain-containing protein n=1 Tax=OM182 bacterium MED-G24 TaxID=1986255 RepID=A0A2A5WW00_9GAMM|nr:hypothetical protein [Gammaproteobacteria bacterium]PDH40397.1 MAG: hypothetical protein CNE99_03605 [OM182 bacterium MED-G24]RPG24253.1 MAG: DNA repair exonuclease [Gammaproteobacteria bacterium TMED50]